MLVVSLGLGCAGGGPAPAATSPSGPAALSAPPKGEDDAAYYHQARALLAAKDGARLKGLDFRRVRRGSMLVNFAEGPNKDGDLDRTLNAAITGGDPQRLLTTARELLDKDIAYVRAHGAVATILHQQGQAAEGDMHIGFANGMLDSILKSGDGRTPASAFVVFHVREEYDVARLLRAQVLRQTLRQEGARSFDMLTVRQLPKTGDGPAEGPERELYFDITELFALEGKAVEMMRNAASKN